MHVLTALFSIVAAWRWGDWRNWNKYHSTMLFIALGNLTYNFIAANHLLWRFTPEHFNYYIITELIYTFIVLPASVLLFLSNYPDDVLKKVIYYIKWIFIFIAFEYFFLINDGIVHQNGWNIWWSLIFLFLMFPLIRLHHTKPLWGYLLAIFMACFVTWYFNIPIEVPIEFRK